jgi:hypothetical protein
VDVRVDPTGDDELARRIDLTPPTDQAANLADLLTVNTNVGRVPRIRRSDFSASNDEIKLLGHAASVPSRE